MNTNQSQPPAVEISEGNFQAEVLECKQPVLVEFWAPWSRPCQILGSVLNEIATTCGERVKIVKVNADDNPGLSMWYEIQSVPTLLCFVDACPRARVVGTASKEAILSQIQSVFHGGDSTSFPPDANKEDGHRNL